MATTKQKQAARKNLRKARASGSRRSKGSRSSKGDQLSTADKNDLPTKVFAFPDERKEPLHDAKHVRNAIARFDQVEGVSDAERDRAWKRIEKAAERYDIEIEASSWRELMEGGRTGGATKGSKTKKKAGEKKAAEKKAAKKKAAKKKSRTKKATTKKAAKKKGTATKAAKKKKATKKGARKRS
jgi:hypothetical protein